jgi:hypothetical protein
MVLGAAAYDPGRHCGQKSTVPETLAYVPMPHCDPVADDVPATRRRHSSGMHDGVYQDTRWWRQRLTHQHRRLCQGPRCTVGSWSFRQCCTSRRGTLCPLPWWSCPASHSPNEEATPLVGGRPQRFATDLTGVPGRGAARTARRCSGSTVLPRVTTSALYRRAARRKPGCKIGSDSSGGCGCGCGCG